MPTNYGFSSLANSVFNSQGLPPELESRLHALENNLIPARVESIILDESHPDFSNLGEWNALGFLKFSLLDETITEDNNPFQYAEPLDPNNKRYPLKNEIVWLIKLPSTSILENTNSTTYYYLHSINLWNHPHHNALPNTANQLPDSQQKDYQQIEGGNVRRVSDGSTDVNLGNTFSERSNIHPLLPFEGDNIIEGRWGNSIRLGSTVKNKNNWSTNGENGDAITIIKNGGESDKEGWIPQTEDINRDDSSIYLTTKQILPLEPYTEDYSNYRKNTPVKISEYDENQVIISSGRLVLNASQNHVLITGKSSVGLSSANSVNIHTGNHFIVKSPQILLGGKDATQSLLYGDDTVKLLKNIFSSLRSLVKTMTVDLLKPQGPYGNSSSEAATLGVKLENIENNLDRLLSKISKTK